MKNRSITNLVVGLAIVVGAGITYKIINNKKKQEKVTKENNYTEERHYIPLGEVKLSSLKK